MPTDKSIQYTAGIDDNPFGAAARRIGDHIAGLGRMWTGVGNTWGTTSESMRAQMGQVTQSVAGGVASMGGHFGSLLEGISRTSAGLTVLVGVAAAMAATKAVKATAEMTESSMDLARVLGSTTNVAQQWRIALEDAGAEQAELEGAAKGMTRQLKENEADMNALGLTTRDAAGNLRPMTELLSDGLDILNGYTQGADRALASQELFGRGVDASSKLLLVNKDVLADAKTTVEELGLEVGANAVAAWKQWDDATDRAGFSLKGMGNTIGTTLMPVLTDLIGYFNGLMPAAIVVVRGALGGLASAFYLVQTGVRVVWETINAFVISVAEPIRAVVEAVGRAMVGDFSGAATVIKSVPGTITTAWTTAFDKIEESAAETRRRIGAIFMPDAQAGTPIGAQGTKTMPKKQDKEKPEGSDMALYDNALAQVKLYYAGENALREFSKAQELEFWNTILQNTQIKSKDRLAINKKTAELEVAVLREKAREAQQLDAIALDSWADRELGRVAASEQAARDAAALGQMSADQLLDEEARFEQSRFAIRQAALMAKLGQLDPERDVAKIAETNAQIEALDQAHQLKLQQIRGQIALQSAIEQRAIWEDLAQRTSGLWDAGVNAMMNGTLRWANAQRAILMELAGWAANIVKRMVVTWIFGEEAKTTATQAGVLTRWAMESWAAAKSVALWAATAVKNIMVSAWEAMAGAYKAIAGIPYVGPFLAPVMAGVAFAGVAGIASNIMSAEGGFDIPRGVNPIVQLHEEEMVLPQGPAQVLRDMADGGGGMAGGERDVNVSLRGASAGDFFLVHRRELVGAIKQAVRDGQLRIG